MLAFLDAFDPIGRWALVGSSCKNTTFLDRAGGPYFNYQLEFLPSGYLHVNRVSNLLSGQKRAGKDDVSALRYAHCEIDCYKGERLDWGNPGVVRQQQQLCMELISAIHGKFGLYPAFIVWSGGGAHLYYRLREEILLTDPRLAPKLGSAEFEAEPPEWREHNKLLRMARAQSIAYVETVNKALAACANGLAASMSMGLHADPVHNVDRILRLPGCENVPSEDKKALGRVTSFVEVMFQALPGQPGYKGFSEQDFAPLLQAYGFDVDAEKTRAAQAAITPPKQGSDYAGLGMGSLAVERARYVLNHIPCDRNAPYTLGGVALSANDYWTWIHMGMALKDALAEAGFAVWAEWSARWESGFDEGFGLKKWHSFAKSGTTFSTAVEIARQFGYDTQKDPWLAKIRELENEGLADEAFAGVQGAEELNGRPVKYEWFGIHRVPVEGGCQRPTAEQYRDPEPLPEALLPVEPFDFDLLPDPLQPYAMDLHKRMQCAPDFIGVATMITLGSVLGPKITIRPLQNSDWTEAANNYGFGIAPSGSMKTPPIEQVLSFIKRLEASKRAEYAEASCDFNRKLKAAEAVKGAAERKIKGDARKDAGLTLEDHVTTLKAADDAAAEAEKLKPIQKRYLTNSFTPASLVELLRQNPDGVLVYRDELAALFESFDREDTAESRSVLIEAHRGLGSYTSDRIGRGFDLHAPSVCCSILGTVQPGVIAPYVRAAVSEGRGADGWLQRFQFMVWPDMPTDWKLVDRKTDAALKERAFKVYEALDQLTWVECAASWDCCEGVPVGRPYLHFDAEAQEIFNGWLTKLKTGLAASGELTPLEGHRSKYVKLVPSTALVCHLAEGNRGPVGAKALNRAIRWAGYLESHARRIYGSGPTAIARAAKEIIAKAKKGDLKPIFTARDIRRKEWASLTDNKVIKEALEMLCDHYWLFDQERNTGGGRPSTVYWLNPKIK